MAGTRLTEEAKGIFIISATPFAEDGRLDLESTDKLTDFYLSKGVHGITILGIMGEAQKLTYDESILFMRRVLKRVNGRVPVVVGVSNPGLATLNALSQQAMDDGAAGVMIAPVTGLHTDEQIYNYFETIFGRIGLAIPICLQDHPLSADVFFSAALVNELISSFPQIVVFKHEDWPGLTKITKIREDGKRSNIRRVSILVGNGGLYLPQELQRGVDGAMTGFSYPEMLVQVYDLFARGDVDAAEDLFDVYLPFTRYEQQFGFGLAVRKYVLCRRGAMASPVTRKPGPRLDKTTIAEVEGLIKRLERRLER